MHPTPQEQLAVLAGIIAEIAADDEVPVAASARLTLVAGQLRRLAGNVSARLAFLQQDNMDTAALLHALHALAAPTAPDPAAVGPEVAIPADGFGAAAADVPGWDGSLFDEVAAHERNKALRTQLTELIGRLGDDPAGDAARSTIVAHLRARTQANPTLNRPRGVLRP